MGRHLTWVPFDTKTQTIGRIWERMIGKPIKPVEGTGPGVSVFDDLGLIKFSASFWDRGQPVAHRYLAFGGALGRFKQKLTKRTKSVLHLCSLGFLLLILQEFTGWRGLLFVYFAWFAVKVRSELDQRFFD